MIHKWPPEEPSNYYQNSFCPKQQNYYMFLDKGVLLNTTTLKGLAHLELTLK
jgi:hypothetical protein